jgi:tetratricopeptide (TPR) repeat protein
VKYLKFAVVALLCAAAVWYLPSPLCWLPLVTLGLYEALALFWQPNRAFALLSAQFLEAQREEGYARAEGLARQCLAQAGRARSNQARLVCQALDMLCTALLAQDKLEEAETAARQLMQESSKTLLSPPELRPPARTLAHVLLRRHKVDEAEALLRKLQDSMLFREYPLQRGAVLGDLASLEAERERPARAAEWNTRAIHLLESHKAPERDLAVLYMNRGDNHAHSGDQASALADYQKAIFLHERCEPESTALAMLLCNAGVAELDLGQTAAAEKTLRRSVDLWQRVATPRDPRFAMTCHNLAQALATQGRWHEAMVFAERSLEVKGGLEHPDYVIFQQALTAIQAACPSAATPPRGSAAPELPTAPARAE